MLDWFRKPKADKPPEAPAAAPAEGKGQAVTFDPSTLSKSEIDVLQRLAEGH